MIKSVKIIVLSFLIIHTICKAQNRFNMSQYMLHHAFINPAAIGQSENINGAIYHRSQWVGLNGAPTTQGFNVNLPFKSAKHTLGLSVLHDKIGINNNSEISLGYAFKARLAPKTSLLLGVSSTLDILKSNYSTLTLNDVADPTFNSNATAYLPNFKYGMYLMNSKYYVGFSIPNLMEDKIVSNGKGQVSFNAANLHYYMQAGYLFTLSSKADLGLSTLLKQVSGSPLQADLNLQFIFMKKVGIGASYRTSKEMVGLFNVQITPMFKVGYSYDYSFSQLRNYNNGSHEILLIFNMISDKKQIGAQIPRF